MTPTRTGEAIAPAAPPPPLPAASAPRAALAVEVIQDPATFDQLERDWNALLQRSDATVFQTFEWLRTWWRHFGEARRGALLHLLAVRDDRELVALAPLWIETSRVMGLLRLRRLLYVGRGDSDYLGVLAARGRERESAEAIAASLARDAHRFDVAVLEDTSDRSRTGPLLDEALRARGWSASRVAAEPCPETALLRSWEDTVAAFRIDHRREIRRRLRNIEREHRVELEVVAAGEDVDPAIREFLAMHQARWEADGYWGAFADPRVVEFHRDVAVRLSARGWLFLAFLRVDGRRRAGNYGFSFRDALATFQGAVLHDPELRRLSPGRVLHARSMEWAIARGRTRYDFLRGAEPYKYDFDASDVPNWTTVAYPRGRRLTAPVVALGEAQAGVLRRARREARALRATARQGGWFSRAMLAHLSRVARRAVRDAGAVARRTDRPTPGG
jgi:CelD/BcsL family acetyltransferase involved in cellulose biosynthesis